MAGHVRFTVETRRTAKSRGRGRLSVTVESACFLPHVRLHGVPSLPPEVPSPLVAALAVVRPRCERCRAGPAGAAHADDLKDKKHKVQKHIKQAHEDLDESSKQLAGRDRRAAPGAGRPARPPAPTLPQTQAELDRGEALDQQHAGQARRGASAPGRRPARELEAGTPARRGAGPLAAPAGGRELPAGRPRADGAVDGAHHPGPRPARPASSTRSTRSWTRRPRSSTGSRRPRSCSPSSSARSTPPRSTSPSSARRPPRTSAASRRSSCRPSRPRQQVAEMVALRAQARERRREGEERRPQQLAAPPGRARRGSRS